MLQGLLAMPSCLYGLIHMPICTAAAITVGPRGCSEFEPGGCVGTLDQERLGRYFGGLERLGRYFGFTNSADDRMQTWPLRGIYKS